MRIWKFPDQVVRLGILLTVAVVALVLVRNRFVPPSFGESGHYRGDAVLAVASQEMRYAGWQLCVECHEEEGNLKRKSYHRKLSCEVCHGPSYEHANDFEAQQPLIPRERGRACLNCHEYLPSRPTGFPQIFERLHNPLKACVDCHDPHDPRPPEIPEACSACHQQIAWTKSVSHHTTLSCETCHETPPQHRETPRSFRPGKPTTREFCGQCHAEDAESERQIPRVDLRTHGELYLCWQCHYPHHPEG